MEMGPFLPQGNAKKTLRMVLMVSMVLLALWLLMVQRMDSGNTPEVTDPQTSERLESVRNLRGLPEEPSEETTDRGTRMMPGALSTFFVLTGILALVWFWARSKPGEQQSREPFRQAATHMLGNGGQHLSVLEINGEIWVLGVTASNVNLLHRYTREEWSDAMPTAQTPPPSSFKDLFKAKL
jgi:flagellar biogenesis protein FliO